MDKIMYRLVFNRRKRLNRNGKALVQVEAYLQGRKKYFTTHIYLRPEQWNEKRSVIVRHPNATSLNHLLNSMIAEIEQVELDFWRRGQKITLEVLKNAMTLHDNEGDFLEFFHQEIRRSSLKESTKRNHLSTLNALRNFRKSLAFCEITYEFLTSFERHLRDAHYHINTIAKHMKHLKRYVNIAINKDLIDVQRYAFRRYKIKTVENKHHYLTPEELRKLESLDLKGSQRRLRKSLDAFLFCCYAGLRYSDFIRLSAANFCQVKEDTWLNYQALKTGINVRLPLNHLFDGKALHLINIYREQLNSFFRLKDNSNVNKDLQRIARIAQIDKHLSFHCARHTNASLLIYKGVNITTVQKLLGHRNVKTTQVYAHVMDKTIINDLKKNQAGA